MAGWLGFSKPKNRVRTLLLIALAVGVASPGSPAGEVDCSAARLKARRELRAAERMTLAPRVRNPSSTPTDVRIAANTATPAVAAAAAAPTPPRLFDAKDAAKDPAIAPAPPANAARPPVSACVVTGRALLGEPQLARFAERIGEVDIERCFAAIPAWKTIKHEDLRPTRARYHFLLRQANQDLSRAIAAAAASRGVTLVVERGGVQNAGDKVADLTQAVLDALSPAP